MSATSCGLRVLGIANLVEASASAEILGDALVVTLDRCGGFAFAYRGGFFIVLAATRLGQHAGFFAGALETAQCARLSEPDNYKEAAPNINHQK
jgi:hypothetical protein